MILYQNQILLPLIMVQIRHKMAENDVHNMEQVLEIVTKPKCLSFEAMLQYSFQLIIPAVFH